MSLSDGGKTVTMSDLTHGGLVYATSGWRVTLTEPSTPTIIPLSPI